MVDDGPWTQYQPQPADNGPWTQYAAPPTPGPPAAVPPPQSSGVMGAASDFLRGARMGAIPYGANIVAAEKTVPHWLGLGGQDYPTNLAAEQASDAALRGSHSIAGNLGQGTGMALQGAALAPIAAPADAGLAAKTAAGAVQGTLASALQGGSPGIGAAVGGALPLAGGLIGKIPIPPAVASLGDDFTRSILNRANVPGSNVSPSTLAAAQNTITENMGNVAGRNTLVRDPQLRQDINAAVEGQATPNAAVQKYADNILGSGWKQDEATAAMPGQDYAALRSEASNKAFRSRLTDPDTADAYRQIYGALDSNMDRSIAANNPADIGLLGPLRSSYGNLQEIKMAASHPAAGANQSILAPQAMQSALRDQGQAGNYALGKGDLTDLTRAAMENIQPPAPQSRLANPQSLHYLGRALGGAAGYATGGWPGAAGGYLAGELGSQALPAVARGVQAARGGIGSLGPMQELRAQLQTPGSPYTLSLARALAAQQLGQANAP